MTLIDDILTELQNSPGITPDNLQRISDFLQQHKAVLETLTDDARQAFFVALAGGDPAAAWTALTENLTAAQLLTLLRDTTTQVADLATLRQKALAEFHSALAGMEDFAIQLLAKAALALLQGDITGCATVVPPVLWARAMLARHRLPLHSHFHTIAKRAARLQARGVILQT